MQRTPENDADYNDYFKQLLYGKTHEEVKKERQEIQEKLKDFPEQEREKDKKEKEDSIKQEQKKLEQAFILAYESRNLEINIFWRRAISFFVGISVVSVAYGSLWVKIISETSGLLVARSPFFFLLLFLNIVGLFLSWLWIKMIDSSKYWQNHWEAHIAHLEPFFSGYLLHTTMTDKKYYSSWGINYTIGWSIFIVWAAAYSFISYIPWDVQLYTSLSSRSVSGVAGGILLASMFVVSIFCKLPKKENVVARDFLEKELCLEENKAGKSIINVEKREDSEEKRAAQLRENFGEKRSSTLYQNIEASEVEVYKQPNEVNSSEASVYLDEKGVVEVSGLERENKRIKPYGIGFVASSFVLINLYIVAVAYILNLFPQYPGLSIGSLFYDARLERVNYWNAFLLLGGSGLFSFVSLLFFHFVKEKFTTDGIVSRKLISAILFSSLFIVVYFLVIYNREAIFSLINTESYLWLDSLKQYIYYEGHNYFSWLAFALLFPFFVVFLDNLDDKAKFILCLIWVSFCAISTLRLSNEKSFTYEGTIYTNVENKEFRELDINNVRVLGNFLSFDKNGKSYIIPQSAITSIDVTVLKHRDNTKIKLSTKSKGKYHAVDREKASLSTHLGPAAENGKAIVSNAFANATGPSPREGNQANTTTDAEPTSLEDNGTVLRYAMPSNKGHSESVSITVSSMKEEQKLLNRVILPKKTAKKRVSGNR